MTVLDDIFDYCDDDRLADEAREELRLLRDGYKTAVARPWLLEPPEPKALLFIDRLRIQVQNAHKEALIGLAEWCDKRAGEWQASVLCAEAWTGLEEAAAEFRRRAEELP